MATSPPRLTVRRRRTRRHRVQASASARGYGHAHQQLRKALIAAWTPGDPCSRCGQPMWGPPRRIHLGHNDDKTAYCGLEHERCNTSDGATRGNAQRKTVAAVDKTAGMTVTVPGMTVTVRHSRTW